MPTGMQAHDVLLTMETELSSEGAATDMPSGYPAQLPNTCRPQPLSFCTGAEAQYSTWELD